MTYQHQIDRAEATLGRIAATAERTEHLLAAVLATLVANPPENMPKSMPTTQLPPAYTQGAHMRAAFPPAMAVPPAQTWMPAPGKAGPAWCYPNPALTPGAANPLVTQENIASTLAVSGWTATVRPPVSTTRVIKQHIMERDGLTGDPAQWELDHWFPIECAGAVCDIANFWCMPYSPYPGAREKDRVENWLKGQIVSGAMTIAQAHAIISDDWYACFLSIQKMGLMPMTVTYDPDGSSDPDDNA